MYFYVRIKGEHMQNELVLSVALAGFAGKPVIISPLIYGAMLFQGLDEITHLEVLFNLRSSSEKVVYRSLVQVDEPDSVFSAKTFHTFELQEIFLAGTERWRLASAVPLLIFTRTGIELQTGTQTQHFDFTGNPV